MSPLTSPPARPVDDGAAIAAGAPNVPSPFPRKTQFRDHAAGERLAHLHDLRIVLQHLARDIERQILAVDDAAHEAQIGGQQLRIIGDEDAPYVKLDMAFAPLIEQIEG